MISQPRYLPSLSYLQRTFQCDTFIILDTVQHHRQDFEHRNRIAGSDGPRWLSLPLDRSVGSRPAISQMRLLNSECLEQHLQQLISTYRKASYFDEMVTRRLYEAIETLSFVDVLTEMLQRTFHCVGLNLQSGSQWVRASELPVPYIKGPEYLARLCAHVGASHYISGPNGRDYITDEFSRAGLRVEYHEDAPPHYERGALPPIPWLAWIDALHHQGSAYVNAAISKPMTLQT